MYFTDEGRDNNISKDDFISSVFLREGLTRRKKEKWEWHHYISLNRFPLRVGYGVVGLYVGAGSYNHKRWWTHKAVCLFPVSGHSSLRCDEFQRHTTFFNNGKTGSLKPCKSSSCVFFISKVWDGFQILQQF